MQCLGTDTIVRHVSAAPVLLVATDFDGAIAPIVRDPAAAAADSVAMDALRRLAWMPRTRAAIVSGRDLADLRRRFPVSDGLFLIGSHGAEILGEPASALSSGATGALAALAADLEALARRHPGSLVEIKSRAVAFHYRRVADAEVASCVEHVVAMRDSHPSLKMRLGSMVVEFVADIVTKADAIRYLRGYVRASAVVFIGDDLTDEDVFAELRPSDAGVKVGTSESLASHRVADVGAVRDLLCALADARQEWLNARHTSADAHGEAP